MNPLKALLRTDWSSPRMRVLDLILAMGTLLYGYATQEPVLIWLGIGAVLLSLLNPMGRLQRWLRGFVRTPGGGR